MDDLLDFTSRTARFQLFIELQYRVIEEEGIGAGVQIHVIGELVV